MNNHINKKKCVTPRLRIQHIPELRSAYSFNLVMAIKADKKIAMKNTLEKILTWVVRLATVILAGIGAGTENLL